MNLLDRYILTTVIGGTLLVLLVLVSLVAFLNFLGEAGRIGAGDYGLAEAFQYVLYSTPRQAWEMFPVAALLGTLLALGGLAAHGELVAMRAAGMSLLQVARAAALGGVSLAVLCVLLGDIIAPPAEQYAQAERALAQDSNLTIAQGQGIWARDGRSYINVRHLADGRMVDGIFIFEFDDAGRMTRSAQAAAARYDAAGWTLVNLEETRFEDAGTTVTFAQSRPWDTQLNPDMLNLFVVDPGSLSTVGLWHYIAYLESNSLDSARYRLAFWSKVVTPFSILVMIVLALPFIAGDQRASGTGQRLFIGMLVGAGFYLVNRVLGFSGEVFDLNPMVVAWLPTTVLAAAALFALTRIR